MSGHTNKKIAFNHMKVAEMERDSCVQRHRHTEKKEERSTERKCSIPQNSHKNAKIDKNL